MSRQLDSIYTAMYLHAALLLECFAHAAGHLGPEASWKAILIDETWNLTVCLCKHPAKLHLLITAGKEDGEKHGCVLGGLCLLDCLVSLLQEVAVSLHVKCLHGLNVLLLGLQMFRITFG